MPVSTATITSRRARRARRNETSRHYFPSSLPHSPSELRNPASFQWTEGSDGAKAKSRSIDNEARAKKVVVFEGEVNMEGGEAQTLAMTHSNPPGGSQTISVPSSNESSPTTTRPPVPGGNSSDDSPQGIERSFKRRRSFSKSSHRQVLVYFMI